MGTNTPTVDPTNSPTQVPTSSPTVSPKIVVINNVCCSYSDFVEVFMFGTVVDCDGMGWTNGQHCGKVDGIDAYCSHFNNGLKCVYCDSETEDSNCGDS